MNRLRILALSTFLLSGCTSTYHCSTVEDFSERTVSRQCTVSLESSKDMHARILRVSGDSVYVVAKGMTDEKALPLSAITHVTTRDYLQGALEGFVNGMGYGFCVGTALLLSGARMNDNDEGFGRLAFPFIGAGIGIIAGTPIGWGLGHKSVIIPPKDTVAAVPSPVP